MFGIILAVVFVILIVAFWCEKYVDHPKTKEKIPNPDMDIVDKELEQTKDIPDIPSNPPNPPITYPRRDPPRR